MNIYERLIENPLFFKWIYHPSPELEDYWERYIQLNPDEARFITDFKKQFELLRYEESTLSELEKRSLAQQIVQKLDAADREKKKIGLLKSILQYAAIAILFFSIGGLLVYQLMLPEKTNYFAQQTAIPTLTNKPVLILNNKDQIDLKDKESVLDYSRKDTIVFNGGHVINTQADDNNPVMNQLIIPYGSHSRIRLSDGTIVWLNAGSRLVYPSRFAKKTREVYLIGEAFFHVHKDPEQPFIVKTGMQEIKVLGTKFNVSAYPEDNVIQTVLAEGSVSLHANGSGLFASDVKLKPNQKASFDKSTKETKIVTVVAGNYTSWTEGLLSFQNTDLSRVIKKLERYYNICFKYDDPLKSTIEISGKLDLSQGRDDSFKYLEQAAGVKFVKLNDQNYEIK
ncbi:FecR family protein [Prolixibacter sp. SD074]|jgi:RNase H-fold protein (predicted Holliday junction resolvase)|uniref:FecR family protein n=1 Tax=Prolixibacter sp. SD074 TaxID=2652391 RepID=UPI00126E358C|nr:FecR domain-containing protein [Prolixibacter sp. SD074]GET28024.1 iron dicitrate transporter FecR [Prolixibacter sp. SD074]